MSLADISKRVATRRVSAVALTLASVIGASAFILHNAHEGIAREDVVDDVRWELPPPSAYLRTPVTASVAQVSTLPTPPAAPQDATELNVAALPPEQVKPVQALSAAPVAPPEPSPVVAEPAPAPVPVAAKPAKPQKQSAPKSDKPASMKQSAKPKTDGPKQAKAKDAKPPRYAKVQELPPAPAIEAAPVAPPPQQNRIPIISSVVDGVNAVGNSLSSLVR
jgi:hypothetical protein